MCYYRGMGKPTLKKAAGAVQYHSPASSMDVVNQRGASWDVYVNGEGVATIHQEDCSYMANGAWFRVNFGEDRGAPRRGYARTRKEMVHQITRRHA